MLFFTFSLSNAYALAADESEYVPSVDYLLSIVRRGSLQMVRKGLCDDVQDDDIIHGHWGFSCRDHVLAVCSTYLGAGPCHQLQRHWSRTHVVRGPRMRVMQWNVLSQSLATGVDKFACVTGDTLDWEMRRWRVVREILTWDPDVVCLQEVDHYR